MQGGFESNQKRGLLKIETNVTRRCQMCLFKEKNQTTISKFYNDTAMKRDIFNDCKLF